MLSEQFISSIGTPTKIPSTSIAKDAAIFIHEFQPLRTQRSVFKKSTSPPNSLAVSSTHIYSAQAEKGVVHVYSREKGNQEAIVPFPERITCISLACDDAVLVVGTAEGRIFVWEVGTGRQVTTSRTHLQAVTVLAVDLDSNFLLSASADSTVQVWSLSALLSFAGSDAVAPLRTFSNHRAEITALAVGHSSTSCNFAVSASQDQTCLIWNYSTGAVLRTYLLPFTPLSLTLDAADRAIYAGYEDSSVQKLDLFTPAGAAQATHPDAPQNATNALTPIQPPKTSRWQSPDTTHGAARSLAISFDSCTLLSGHESGSILAWDVGRGALQSNVLQNPLPGPINNLAFLPVNGFEESKTQTRRARIAIPSIVKPKFAAFDTAEGVVPGSYALQAELISNLPSSATPSIFQQAVTAPTFPDSLLNEGLAELVAWSHSPSSHTLWDEESTQQNFSSSGDFMALDGSKEQTLEEQNAALKAQVEALRRLQGKSFEVIERLRGRMGGGAGSGNGNRSRRTVDEDEDEDEDESD